MKKNIVFKGLAILFAIPGFIISILTAWLFFNELKYRSIDVLDYFLLIMGLSLLSLEGLYIRESFTIINKDKYISILSAFYMVLILVFYIVYYFIARINMEFTI